MPSHKNKRVTGYLLLNFLESLADLVYTLYGFGHLLEDSKGLLLNFTTLDREDKMVLVASIRRSM